MPGLETVTSPTDQFHIYMGCQNESLATRASDAIRHIRRSRAAGHNAPAARPRRVFAHEQISGPDRGRGVTPPRVRPWEILSRALAPDGSELVLSRRGDEYLIRAGGFDLMSSRDDLSARALAELGCAPLRGRAGLRVLIGGLGMGYSLAAALAQVPDDAEVEVVELVEAVVEWNRGPLAELAGRPLDDPRARLTVADVGARIRSERGAYDAILLDVDNGPDPLAHDHNAKLYGLAGLREAHRALRPGGVYGVWSYSDAGAFARTLRRAGFEAAVERVANRGRDRGRTHAIWLGRK